MATDITPVEGAQVDDYASIPKPRAARINPEARISPTCMIWAVAIGVGLQVCVVLMWAIGYIGSHGINFFPQ